MKSRLDFSENKIDHLQCSLLETKRELMDAQAHMMKENLVFYNVPEIKGENTRQVLITFIKQQMKVADSCFDVKRLDSGSSLDIVWIRTCHRIGQVGNLANRPILAMMIEGKIIY